MLAAERRSNIVRMTEQHGSVRVSELSKLFGVTEETIRRDLEELEKNGYLKRTYGGAISVKGTGFEMPFTRRVESNRKEKNLIGKQAAALVKEGETVMLDASTTALWVARHLVSKRHLTVMTNSVQIVMELANRPGINVISTGGNLRDRSLSFVGPLAQRAVASYFVDKLFMSGKGLAPEEGLTDSNELEVELKKQMMTAARESICVVDSSKIGHKAFARIAGVEDFTKIITDPGIEPAMADAIRQKGTELIIASSE